MEKNESAASGARHRAQVRRIWHGSEWRVSCWDCLHYERFYDETTAHREALRHEVTSTQSAP